MEFSQAGFETRKVENIQVSTTQEVTVNQSLAVAGATTVIELQEAPPGVPLAKSTATIERVLPQEVIQNLPLTGATRDVNTLTLLAPAVNRGPGSNNNFMVDGVDNNDVSVMLANGSLPPEALSEFQTQTSAYSAEFGRSSGAQINGITRSGANQVHGDVWDYYRGNWMEPVNLLNKRAGLTSTPQFVHNQAGGDAGLPVLKDRTFLFGLFQANIGPSAPDARNASSFTIPTAEGCGFLRSVPLRQGRTQASRDAVL